MPSCRAPDASTGRPHGWKASVTPGTTAAFEILSIDPDKRRIGVALLAERAARAEEKALADAEAAEVREYSEREEAEGFGSSLADKLRGAFKPREK